MNTKYTQKSEVLINKLKGSITNGYTGIITKEFSNTLTNLSLFICDYIINEYEYKENEFIYLEQRANNIKEYYHYFKDLLNNMDYKDYLASPYWKIISNERKRIDKNVCRLCNGDKNLNVHHSTYINRGFEFNNMSDIITLCCDCHSHHHNKQTNKPTYKQYPVYKKKTPKKIYQYNLTGELINTFNSSDDAFINTGIPKQNIYMSCSNRIKTTGGFIFKYTDTTVKNQKQNKTKDEDF